MQIKREENEVLFDDLIISEYIKTDKNEYRLIRQFVGAIQEDGEAVPECSIMCDISLNETTHNDGQTIEAIKQILIDKGLDPETSTETIYISSPDIRRTLSIIDESSFDSSEDIRETIIKALEKLEG